MSTRKTLQLKNRNKMKEIMLLKKKLEKSRPIWKRWPHELKLTCSIVHHLTMGKNKNRRKHSETLKQNYVPEQIRLNFICFSLSRFKSSSNVFRSYKLDFFVHPMHYYPFCDEFYFTRAMAEQVDFLFCYWSMRTVLWWCSWGKSSI